MEKRIQSRLGPLFGWVAAATMAAACGAGPPPDTPSPAFDMSPAHVCRGRSTDVRFDASSSSANLTLVPAGEERATLRYRWRIRGGEWEVVDGSLREPTLTVRTPGERPLHVRLRVDKVEGGALEVEQTLPVTVARLRRCRPSCPEGWSCRELDGRSLCLPQGECDDDAACDGCYVCSSRRNRCVPPSTAREGAP